MPILDRFRLGQFVELLQAEKDKLKYHDLLERLHEEGFESLSIYQASKACGLAHKTTKLIAEEHAYLDEDGRIPTVYIEEVKRIGRERKLQQRRDASERLKAKPIGRPGHG